MVARRRTATNGELRSISLFAASRGRALRPELISFGIFEATGDYLYRRHQHLTFEAIVPIAGTYRCRLNGQELVLARPQVLLVKPQDWHEDILAQGVSYWAFSFRIADASLTNLAGWFAQGITPQNQIAAPPSPAVRTLLRRMRLEAQTPDALSLLLQDAILGELVWTLARSYPREVLGTGLFGLTQVDPLLPRLERWFESRVQMQVTVGEMARAMGLSPTALGLRCHHLLGMAPAKAFTRFKIERARELLLGTTMNVVEVSEHLGFENPFHFSRVFRRHYPYPPSHVKRSRPGGDGH